MTEPHLGKSLMEATGLFAVLGLAISTLAAFAAFLITYEEWSHHYAGTREPLRYGVEAAVVAFAVFVTLTAIAAAFVNRFLSG